jgi:GGDEF domain-containing protein
VHEISRKSKMISFRLSGEEFRLLQGACSKAGARSVSELARAAMQRIILEEGFRPDSTDSEVRELKLRFNVLAAEVQRLARLVQEPAGNGVQTRAGEVTRAS